MNKALLYVRTATSDPESKYRLAKQELYLRSYCIDNNISVIDCFSEICSGSDFNRPQWKALISYIRNNPGLIDLLLIHRWDRFSRNLKRALSEMNRLNKLGVEINCPESYIDFSNLDSKLYFTNCLVMPEIESTNKRVKSKFKYE